MLLRRHREKPTADAPVMPNGNASKAEWIAYALAVGATREDVEGLKRDEVRELYGPQDPPPPPVFDPSTHTPDEVLAYLRDVDGTDPAAHDAEVVRVVEAERAGAGRAEILEAVEGTPVSDPPPPAPEIPPAS